MPNDYGYFGKGSTGYVHYQQTFNRCFGSGSGGGGGGRKPSNNNNGSGNNDGCLTLIAIFLVVGAFILAALSALGYM